MNYDLSKRAVRPLVKENFDVVGGVDNRKVRGAILRVDCGSDIRVASYHKLKNVTKWG